MRNFLLTLSLDALANIYNDAARSNGALRIYEFRNKELAVDRTMRQLEMAEFSVVPADNRYGYALLRFPVKHLRGEARVIRKTGRTPSSGQTTVGYEWDKLQDGDTFGEFEKKLGRKPTQLVRRWTEAGYVHVVTWLRAS